MAGALAVVAGGPFRLDTVVLDLEATLGLTEAEDVDAEELLFLVLDVFKCIGPVLEVLSLLAEAAAEGSILSADLALATMPVLMEPDFIYRKKERERNKKMEDAVVCICIMVSTVLAHLMPV